jgi:hypothetical protein
MDRLPLRDVRVDPDRVDRVLRVLRALRSLRVIGTLLDPVREDPLDVLVLAVWAWAAAEGAVPAAAMPQALQ